MPSPLAGGSMPNDKLPGASSLPPGDVTPAELLRAAFPLVVQAATEAATAATVSAEQGRAQEQALTEFKTVLEKNTEAVHRYAEALERQNQINEEHNLILDRQQAATEEDKRQIYSTVRTTLTSPVLLQVLQLIAIIGSALGLWAALPS